MAQQAGRTYRLGCLMPLTRDAPVNVAFLDEFRRRGFVEGQNLIVEWRAYGLHPELISQYAAELVKAQVDVIHSGGLETIRALQQATKTIPIVAMTGDMLGDGFVKSLARPEGNTTRVSILAGENDGKRQDILIEAVPGLRLMAVLVDVNVISAASGAKLDELQKAARARGIGVKPFSKRAVDRSKKLASLIPLTLVAPEPRHVNYCAQLCLRPQDLAHPPERLRRPATW
jgi:putative ABC transport system substrate-binding protein